MRDFSQEWDDLLFGVRRSVRYHARRRVHYDRIHKTTLLVALLFGSGTLATLVADAGEAWTMAFAGVVTIFSALDLVIGSAAKARDHHYFERRWISLEQEMVKSIDETRLGDFTEKRLSVEADEEPPLRVLDVLCHNELVRAMDREDEKYDVGFWQKVFSQWFDFRQESIRRANAH